MSNKNPANDIFWIKKALTLAKKGVGRTSPNPTVGAVIVSSQNCLLGEGWHHRAGYPHAEIEAIRNCISKGLRTEGSTIYVTLEPCSTYGRTGPCVKAIQEAGIKRVVYAASDPNPRHCDRAKKLLSDAGISVTSGILADQSARLNEPFNHWITTQKPFVTLKCAMSLDGKIATRAGVTQWITSQRTISFAYKFRTVVDAILVGVNTVLSDDCSLTVRKTDYFTPPTWYTKAPKLRRIILDSKAQTPLHSKVVSDEFHNLTTIIVTKHADSKRIAELQKLVTVWIAPSDSNGHPQLEWVLQKLGQESITHLLIEGGPTVNAAFLRENLVNKIHFYYSPRIIGGKNAPSGIAGEELAEISKAVSLHNIKWKKLEDDFLLTADVITSCK